MVYNDVRNKQEHQKQKENKKMKNTRGWYTFADGYRAWFFGLRGNDKKVEIKKHGKIVKFEAN